MTFAPHSCSVAWKALAVYAFCRHCVHGEPNYIMSSSAHCPTGASVILTKSECQAAAVALLLRNTTPTVETRSTYPAGCFRLASTDLFFNAGGMQAGSTIIARAVCSWTVPTTATRTTVATTSRSTPTTTTTNTPPPEDGLGYRGKCSTSINHQEPDNLLIPVRNTTTTIPSVGTNFDARSRWPFCFTNFTIPAQGACGSCWAFATAQVARSRACIHDCIQNGRCDTSNVVHGRHVSVQQIMGCGSSRAGCDGGWAYQAYDAMKERLAWNSEIPYQCGQGNIISQFQPGGGSCVTWPWGTANHPQVCQISSGYARVDGYYRLPLHTINKAADVMAAELVANGPVAVDFCVRYNFFGFWSSDMTRIYTDSDGCKHGPVVGAHMAMIVGFNARNGVNYWIVQNSWSDKWAHNGYFYMERGVNLCGIENKASAPTVSVKSQTAIQSTITTSTTVTTNLTSRTSIAAAGSSTTWSVPLTVTTNLTSGTSTAAAGSSTTWSVPLTVTTNLTSGTSTAAAGSSTTWSVPLTVTTNLTSGTATAAAGSSTTWSVPLIVTTNLTTGTATAAARSSTTQRISHTVTTNLTSGTGTAAAGTSTTWSVPHTVTTNLTSRTATVAAESSTFWSAPLTGRSSTTITTTVTASTTATGSSSSTSCRCTAFLKLVSNCACTSTTTSSSSTTSSTSSSVILLTANQAPNATTRGVSWEVFLAVLASLLTLLAGTAVSAGILWSRYSKLRRRLRSQRPSLIPRVSWAGTARLREHADADSPANSGTARVNPNFEPPQMMGVGAP